jgi:hypothetical protein
MRIDARNIVRYARRHRLRLQQGSIGNPAFGDGFCALAIVGHMVLGPKTADNDWIFVQLKHEDCFHEKLKEIGLTPAKLRSLEVGYEDFPRYKAKNTRWYKMGVRVRKMSA